MTYRRFNSISKSVSLDSLQGIKIAAPATGKLSIIKDRMLLALGEGVVIELTKGSIASPFNAKVIDILPAHGKVILQAANKLRFLIQLPQHYAENMGLGIKLNVKVGDTVAAGQVIMELDLYKIQKHLKPVQLMFILLDSSIFGRVQVPHHNVQMMEDVAMSLVPLKKKKPAKQE